MTLLREPGTALELIDRYLLRTLNLQAIGDAGKAPPRIAVVIEFAEFVVPRGDALQLGGPFAANVVKVLGWANDPAIRAGQHRHRAGQRGAERSERSSSSRTRTRPSCTCRCRARPTCSTYVQMLAAD